MAAASYPAELVAEHRLGDGRTVTIRPVRPDDVGRIRAFLGATSAESRYKRFQKWIRAPSDNLVQFLTAIDHDRHVALVCATAAGADEQIVGEARYIAEPDGTTCEFGVMIADAWRRSGIAGMLMESLMRAARDRGFETMEGFVLARNAAMLRFAHALGFDVEPIADDLEVVRVVRHLRTPASG